jgi:hypothetical protein
MAKPDEFAAANRRAAERRANTPVAVAARYDRRRDRIVIGLNTGLELAFPPSIAQGLRNAEPSDLSAIELSPSGFGIHFPKLDADLYLPALLEGIFGSKAWMAAQLGSEGGKSRSRAKTVAARANGKRGGRPRKNQPHSAIASPDTKGGNVASAHYRLFAKAMKERKQVVCTYDRYAREVCPVILGHSQGQEKALTFQFAGGSKSGLPQGGEWRCLFLSRVTEVKLKNGPWHSGDSHSQPQGCVETVDLDVNPDSPYKPKRRLARNQERPRRPKKKTGSCLVANPYGK